MTETFFTIISLISIDAEGVIAKQALSRYGNFSSIEKCNLALEKHFEEVTLPYKQTQGENKKLLVFSYKNELNHQYHSACIEINFNEELIDFYFQ